MGYLKKDPAGAFASWNKHELMSNGQGQPDIGKVLYEVARINMFLLAQC